MWNKIYITKQQIEHETGRAALIKCPSESEFKGCAFWHPIKLMRNQGYAKSFSFTSEFEFKLIKKGIHIHTLDADEMLELFRVSHENIESNLKHIKNKEESFLEVTEPVEVEVTFVEVDGSLRR